MSQIPKKQDTQPTVWPGKVWRPARYSCGLSSQSLLIYTEFFPLFMSDVPFWLHPSELQNYCIAIIALIT